VVPPAPPKPPSRIAKLHQAFLDRRDLRLTDEPPLGLGMAECPPDEPPNWGQSSATLTQWCALFPPELGFTEETTDTAIKALFDIWLEEPYWASPVDRKTGKPSTPYPWGAFLSEKQWRKAYEKLTAEVDARPAGAH
jgi:hypothetical protein